MGAGFGGGHYMGTEGYMSEVKSQISSLPKNPDTLINRGWKETTHSGAVNSSRSRLFKNPQTGLEVRFDKADPNARGFKSKDHYHVLNPLSNKRGEDYLDKDGNPVDKNSKKSHIFVK